MDTVSFLKMDVFFFVTTVFAVLSGTLTAIILCYLLRIVRDISTITTKVRKETDGIVKDLNHVRHEIKDGVSEVKDQVEQGVANVETYGKMMAGAGLVRALGTVYEALSEEAGGSKGKRRRITKRTTS